MHQPGQVRLRVRRQSARPLTGLPHAEGQCELGLDLVRGAHVEGVYGVQRPGDEFEPRGTATIQQADIGRPRGRAAQFGLGQQPQMDFRALAVHVPSVLPAARSNSLAADPDQMLAAAPDARRAAGEAACTT